MGTQPTWEAACKSSHISKNPLPEFLLEKKICLQKQIHFPKYNHSITCVCSSLLLGKSSNFYSVTPVQIWSKSTAFSRVMIYTSVNESKISHFVKTKIKISEPVWISTLVPNPKFPFLLRLNRVSAKLFMLLRQNHALSKNDIFLHVDRLQTLLNPPSLF